MTRIDDAGRAEGTVEAAGDPSGHNRSDGHDLRLNRHIWYSERTPPSNSLGNGQVQSVLISPSIATAGHADRGRYPGDLADLPPAGGEVRAIKAATCHSPADSGCAAGFV